MAIYHLSCKIISRGEGRSAVAAAAYRAGIALTNDDVTHDYSQKGGVVHSNVLLPGNAPREWSDRGILWNAVESAEKSVNAQLAREIEVALPAELTRAEQIKLTEEYARKNFTALGMCADINIHDKRDGNPHAHIMLTVRPLDEFGNWSRKKEKVYLCKNEAGEERGFTAKELAAAGDDWEKQLPYYPDGDAKKKPLYLTAHEAEQEEYKNYSRAKGKNNPKTAAFGKELAAAVESWNGKDSLERWRAEWAAACNDTFENLHLSERIDHRSYERQGIEKEPGVHLGAAAKHMKLENAASDRERINEEIRAVNAETEAEKATIGKIQSEIDRLHTLLVAHTYGITGDVKEDGDTQFNTRVAAKLGEEYARCLKSDMELQGFQTATGRVSEYRRKAAALREKHSEYANLGKEIKSLRERFAKTGLFGAKERAELAERINALTKERAEIATSAKKQFGLSSPDSMRDKAKEYRRLADTLAANLAKTPGKIEREKSLDEYNRIFAKHRQSVAELPAAADIFDLFNGVTAELERKILADKQEHYDAKSYLKNAKARIADIVSEIPFGRQTTGTARPAVARLNLIIDLRNNMKAQNAGGYARWAKVFNLKQAAQTLAFLEENGLASYGRLSETANAAQHELTEIRAKITDAEKRLKDNAAMQKHIRQYARTRAVYDGYKKSGYSKAYKAEHKSDIAEHQEAKKFFGGISGTNGKGLPKISELREEYAKILTEKKELYPRYAKLKARANDVVTARKNIDLYLGIKEQDVYLRDNAAR